MARARSVALETRRVSTDGTVYDIPCTLDGFVAGVKCTSTYHNAYG